MKFGKRLDGCINPAWVEFYIDYRGLKKNIKAFVNFDCRSQHLNPSCLQRLTGFAKELFEWITFICFRRRSLRSYEGSRSSSPCSVPTALEPLIEVKESPENVLDDIVLEDHIEKEWSEMIM
eukprot:929219_1